MLSRLSRKAPLTEPLAASQVTEDVAPPDLVHVDSTPVRQAFVKSIQQFSDTFVQLPSL